MNEKQRKLKVKFLIILEKNSSMIFGCYQKQITDIINKQAGAYQGIRIGNFTNSLSKGK